MNHAPTSVGFTPTETVAEGDCQDMTESPNSPPGRRILIAPVTGEIGERIQRWREEHDPEQALRIPPHATLCYWAPDVDLALLKQQVRHAFDRPVTARLGAVRQFGNRDRTLYVEVLETGGLDAARARLYDGTHYQLPGDPTWTWHITCVRSTRGKAIDQLLRAAESLKLDCAWRLDTIAYMELRDKRYMPLAEWSVA